MIVSHPSLLSSSVLILNRSYMAVHRVSVRQACLLLYREAAEVIDVVQQSVRFSRRNLFCSRPAPLLLALAGLYANSVSHRQAGTKKGLTS